MKEAQRGVRRARRRAEEAGEAGRPHRHGADPPVHDVRGEGTAGGVGWDRAGERRSRTNGGAHRSASRLKILKLTNYGCKTGHGLHAPPAAVYVPRRRRRPQRPRRRRGGGCGRPPPRRRAAALRAASPPLLLHSAGPPPRRRRRGGGGGGGASAAAAPKWSHDATCAEISSRILESSGGSSARTSRRSTQCEQPSQRRARARSGRGRKPLRRAPRDLASVREEDVGPWAPRRRSARVDGARSARRRAQRCAHTPDLVGTSSFGSAQRPRRRVLKPPRPRHAGTATGVPVIAGSICSTARYAASYSRDPPCSRVG